MEVDRSLKYTGDDKDSIFYYGEEFVGADPLPEVETTFSMGESDLLFENAEQYESEKMALYYAIALELDRGDYATVVEECESYLEYVTAAEVELEGSHPKFSEVVTVWVEDEAAMREADGESQLTRAMLYTELLEELRGEYAEAVESGDLEATAEWDVIARIIATRVDEYTLRDIMAYSKGQLALAA